MLKFLLSLTVLTLTTGGGFCPAQSRPAPQPNSTAAREMTHSATSNESTITDPVANPQAVVTVGKARFTVLTSRLIRMEWAADGKFEDHASFVFLNRRMPVPQFHAQKTGDGQGVTISTTALTLTYHPDTAGDGEFSAQNLSIRLNVAGNPVTWQPGMKNPENLMGTTRTLDGARGDKTREPIGQGLVSRAGWALIDDSTRPLFDSSDFRFLKGEQSQWPWVMLRPAGARQDCYFFGYGHDYRAALGDFVRVAGRIPLPPRFAFGTWWSRYWAYSDQEILRIANGFRENDTPLDVFVIDMDWHINEQQLKAMGELDQSGHTLGWSGYTWNKVLFPYPKDFLDRLHADGLKTSLNLHPASGVEPWEQQYPAMARAMGIDPATKKYVPFNIADKKYATNYMNILHHPLEKEGIDFWWLDWQQEPTTSLPGVSPTWWLNYVHFTDQQREGKRPLLFHRWGGLGNHRYQIGFSGDTVSVWDSLAFQPWFTATAANVGYAYWSHDIGGHMPGAVDPELYTRWVQFGEFSPILRTHTTKNPESERRIWAYPEPYSSILRKSFQMRYAMQPYIYTEARRTYDTGVAFVHPLYYDWPEEDEAYSSRNEYMFGNQMLVAPVVKAGDTTTGLATESIWLPKGEWVEWPSGKHFSGPITIQRSYSIEQSPVFVKAGAIVPMEPPMLYTGQKPVDPLIVNVWPMASGESSHYSVYEDSGKAVEYQYGAWTKMPVKAAQNGNTLRVEIGPVEGSFLGMMTERGYELRLPSDWPPASVTVNGVAVKQANALGKDGWSFDGNTLTTVIPIAHHSVHDRVIIEVTRSTAQMANRNKLDGFAGAMTRLRGSYEALQQTWPVAQPPDALIHAMQTGDRLGYHPETAAAEMAAFQQSLAEAREAVAKMSNDFDTRMAAMEKQFAHSSWRKPDTASEQTMRTNAMKRAETLVNIAAE